MGGGGNYRHFLSLSFLGLLFFGRTIGVIPLLVSANFLEMFYYYSLKPKYNVSISLYCKILITERRSQVFVFSKRKVDSVNIRPSSNANCGSNILELNK